MRSNTFISL